MVSAPLLVVVIAFVLLVVGLMLAVAEYSRGGKPNSLFFVVLAGVFLYVVSALLGVLK